VKERGAVFYPHASAFFLGALRAASWNETTGACDIVSMMNPLQGLCFCPVYVGSGRCPDLARWNAFGVYCEAYETLVARQSDQKTSSFIIRCLVFDISSSLEGSRLAP
jgi:hypothetical protein